MTVVCSLSNAVHLFGMNMMIFLTYVVTSVGTLTLLVLSSLRGLQHFSQRQVVFYLLALCLSPCSHRNCLASRTHKTHNLFPEPPLLNVLEGSTEVLPIRKQEQSSMYKKNRFSQKTSARIFQEIMC